MRPAADLRARVLADYPAAVEVARGLNSKTFDIGNGQRRLVQRMAPVHWRANLADGAEQWKEIDLTLTQGPGGAWRVVSGFYAVQIDPTQVAYRYATNRAGGATQVQLAQVAGAAPDYSAMTVQVQGNKLRWNDVAPGVDMYVVCRPKYVELFKVVKDAAAARSFTWQVTEDNDGNPTRPAQFVRDTQGRDANRDPMEIATLVSNERILADGRRRFLYRETWSGRVSRITDPATRQRGWFTDPTYPAVIDATVTENIGAGADDVQEFNPGFFYDNSPAISVGKYYRGYQAIAGLRFQTVAVPQAATVSSATLTVRVTFVGASPSGNIYADDVDSAAAWSSGNKPSGITKTTATTIVGTPTTGLHSYDVTAVVQEILDRAGWASNNNMRFGWFGTNGGTNNYFNIEAYEAAGTDEAQLDITYTAGGGGATGTAAGTLPHLTASASGGQTFTGTAAPSLPHLTASATGVMQPKGTAAATLPHLSASASGAESFIGTGSPSLPHLTGAASGYMAPTGTATATLPSLTATAAGTFSAGVPTSNLIDVTGSYAPIVGIEGGYTPTINATGSYTPTIDVAGRSS